MRKTDRKILCNQIKYIGNPCIARLGKRVGVKRIGGSAHDAVRTAMRKFLKKLLSTSIEYAESRWRKSVDVQDVKDAAQTTNGW